MSSNDIYLKANSVIKITNPLELDHIRFFLLDKLLINIILLFKVNPQFIRIGGPKYASYVEGHKKRGQKGGQNKKRGQKEEYAVNYYFP